MVNGEWRNLGYFDDIRDAVKARERLKLNSDSIGITEDRVV